MPRSCVPVRVVKKVFEQVDLEIKKPQLAIYEISYGAGQPRRFLLTPGYMELPLGSNDLCIKLLGSEMAGELLHSNPDKPYQITKKVIKYICNAGFDGLSYKTMDDDQEVTPYDNLVNAVEFHRTHPSCEFLLEPDILLTREELAAIKKIKPEDFRGLCETYLSDGLDVDTQQLYFFTGFLPRVIYQELKPAEVMPYQPHAFDFTNPKTGKSTMAAKTGVKYDKASPAKVLGFATAQDIIRGDIQGRREATFFDEVADEQDEEIYAKILPYMEQGEFISAKGKETIRTQAYSPLVFLGNVKEHRDHEYLQIESFQKVLKILTNNFEAFGSRVALVLWNNRAKEVSGSSLSRKDLKLISAQVKTVFELVSPKLEELLLRPEVEEWFKKPLPEYYARIIKETAQGIEEKEVREFWIGHTGSYRHVKLFCFNQAVVDHAIPLLNDGEANTSEFLKSCINHLDRVLELNISSLKRMVKLTEGHERELFSHSLDSLSPLYLRYLVLGFLWHARDKELSEFTTVQEIGSSYQDIPEALIEHERYGYWSRVIQKIPENVKGINQDLELRFGIRIERLDSTLAIRIIDNCQVEKIKKVSYTPLGKSGKSGKKGTTTGAKKPLPKRKKVGKRGNEKGKGNLPTDSENLPTTNQDEKERNLPELPKLPTPLYESIGGKINRLLSIFKGDEVEVQQKWAFVEEIIGESRAGDRVRKSQFLDGIRRKLSPIEIQAVLDLGFKEVGNFYRLPEGMRKTTKGGK